MKVRLTLLIISLLANISIAYANAPRAFFVFRNDSVPTLPIFVEDVDSIVNSKVGIDSLIYEDFVTHEIWTADTVYRTPLSAIDHVAIKTPPTVYKPNAVVIDGTLMDYIISADAKSVYIDPMVPTSVMPNVGDSIVSLKCSHIFPQMFMAEITKVTKDDDRIICDYDSLSIFDVVERHYGLYSKEIVDISEPQSRNGISPEVLDPKLKPWVIPYTVEPADIAKITHKEPFNKELKSSKEYNFFKKKFDVETEIEQNNSASLSILKIYGNLEAAVSEYRHVLIVEGDHRTDDISFMCDFACSYNTLFGGSFGCETSLPTIKKSVTVPEILLNFYFKWDPLTFNLDIGGYYADLGNEIHNKQRHYFTINTDRQWLAAAGIALITPGTQALAPVYAINAIRVNHKACKPKIISKLGEKYLIGEFNAAVKSNIRIGVEPLWGIIEEIKLPKQPKLPFGIEWPIVPDFNINKLKLVNMDLHLDAELSLLDINANLCVPDFDSVYENPTSPIFYNDIKNKAAFEASSKFDIFSALDLALFECDMEYKGNEIEIGLLKNNLEFFRFTPWKHIWKKYEILPTFKDLKFDGKEISTVVCDSLLYATDIGFKIFDSLDSLEWKYDKPESYKYPESQQYAEKFTTMSTTVPKLMPDRKYTAFPFVNHYGAELAAEPSLDIDLTVDIKTESPTGVTKECAYLNGSFNNRNSFYDNYEIIGGIAYKVLEVDSYSYREDSIAADGTISVFLDDLAPDTSYSYYTYVSIDGEYFNGKPIIFKTKADDEEEPQTPECITPDPVDLGLSVMWSPWNIGAESPEDYGMYFAWGETEPKDEYTWYTYFDGPYSESGDWLGYVIDEDISMTEYDAATQKFAEGWRMPSYEEMNELLTCCQWEWTQFNDINGYQVTGPNGNSIFLPAAGNYDGTALKQDGSYGGYWTSTPIENHAKCTAGNLYFYMSTLRAMQWSNRYTGRSIRPVKDYPE